MNRERRQEQRLVGKRIGKRLGRKWQEGWKKGKNDVKYEEIERGKKEESWKNKKYMKMRLAHRNGYQLEN